MLKRIKYTPLIGLGLVICAFCISFALTKKEKVYKFQGIAMTIPYEMQIAEPLSSQMKQKIQVVIADTFQEIDSCFNHWNPHSEISKINQATTTLSAPLSSMIIASKNLYDLTGGRFDPTLKPFIAKVKTALYTQTEIPQELNQSKMKFLGENLLEDIKHHQITFDFDGLSKGHCVDLLSEKFSSLGIKNFLINWGGELKASGSKYKKPWKIFVFSIKDTIELSDLSIASSGAEAQTFYVNDKLYSHIINPKTMTPIEIKSGKLSSISVTCKSCALADALATAAMTFENMNSLLEWITQIESKLRGVKFWYKVYDKTTTN